MSQLITLHNSRAIIDGPGVIDHVQPYAMKAARVPPANVISHENHGDTNEPRLVRTRVRVINHCE